MLIDESPGSTLTTLVSDETSEPTSPIEALLSAAQPAQTEGPLVGDVVAARDPARPGRARVSWCDLDGSFREQWLRTLAHVGVRPGDRVLLVRPRGWSEEIVTGVIDGFSTRPAPEPSPAATLALQADESVRITDQQGAPLVEVRRGDGGPVVRLCQSDVAIEMPGSLRIDASSIELHARQGGVEVTATDDVVVQGESVRLN